jgi:CDP-diacylglycerol--serine O-phosphatidyltransferase
MPLKASNASLLAIALLVILSYLMISKIKYYSFKSLTLKKQKPYLFVIIIASTVALILTFSKVLLISIAFIYLVSGISIQIVELHRKHKATASLSFDKGK